MWKRLKSSVLLKHPRLTVLEDDVRLPSGQVIQYLRFAGTTNGVCIICLKDGKVLVQREYSYPPNATLYQFPGGAIEPNEDPKDAAMREVLEESGVKPGRLSALGSFYLNNRRDSAKMYVFLAEDSKGGFEMQPDPEESITSIWVPVHTLKTMIAKDQMDNFSLLAAWALFQSKRAAGLDRK